MKIQIRNTITTKPGSSSADGKNFGRSKWTPGHWSTVAMIVFMITFGFASYFSSQSFAYSMGFGNGHMGRWMTGGWSMGGFGMIFMFLFWILLIAGIIFLIRWI